MFFSCGKKLLVLVRHCCKWHDLYAALGDGQCVPGPGKHTVIAFKNLELQRQDAANSFWVAEANELTSVQTLQPCSKDGQEACSELQRWLGNIPLHVLQHMQNRLSQLAA